MPKIHLKLYVNGQLLPAEREMDFPFTPKEGDKLLIKDLSRGTPAYFSISEVLYEIMDEKVSDIIVKATSSNL